MYSRGARKRMSNSGPEGMISASTNNLRYRQKEGKKTLRTKGRELKLKKENSKQKRSTSRLFRALNKSYDLEKPDYGNAVEAINIKRHTLQLDTRPIKKRLSRNDTGSSNSDRPLTLVTQTPKWQIEERIRKENMDIKSNASHKSTFEEMNTETKESFGRLTHNLVSLKLQLNQEFSSNIDEEIRRKESTESDDSFIELANRGTPFPKEDSGFEVSELIKGRNASKLLRSQQDLEFVKKAVHNSFKIKQEAKAKRLKQQQFDEEFLMTKPINKKKRTRRSAVRRLFNKASQNVSSTLRSNMSTLSKRLSKGTSNFSLRLSSEKKEAKSDEEFDLDSPNVQLTPQNMKRLHVLIAKNDVEKITLKLKEKKAEEEDKEEAPEVPLRRVKNRNSEVAAQKFKQHMEEKRKMSFAEKKMALKMRRQRHSAKVTHSNVVKLDELRQKKLSELQKSSRSDGNRLHTRKVLHKRRDRSALTKRLLDALDATSGSDSDVSTDSLIELENLEDAESIKSLVEETQSIVESLVEESESVESLVEETESVDSLVEVLKQNEEEDEDSLVQLSDAEEDSGSVLEVNSEGEIVDAVRGTKKEIESDTESEGSSVIITNQFIKKTPRVLVESLIDLSMPSSSLKALDADTPPKPTSRKQKHTTRSRDALKKHSDKTRRGSLEGNELPTIPRRRHPKASSRLSKRRLDF